MTSDLESWKNLPDDIISLIMKRLYYSDQIRFRAVCKNWRSRNINAFKHADKLPWAFAYSTKSLCYLYDPSHERKYACQKNNILNGARVLASKYGWILFSKKENYITSSYLVFFYSPFTDTIIELPRLAIPRHHKATFSASPTSLECVVVVAAEYFRYGEICISTCGIGDRTWTIHQKEICGFWFGEDIDSVAYIEGVLYCTFKYETLICAFEAATKKIYMLPLPEEIGAIKFLVESDGNLLIVVYDYHNMMRWRVFRFDYYSQTEKCVEVEVENLGKKMFFCSEICTSISVPAVEEASELAKTIHYFDPVFNCCFTQSFKADWIDGLVAQTYRWINEQEELTTYIWIQPPQSE